MKTFEEKSRESYNQKADDYDNSFEGEFTRKFKRIILERITIEPGDHVLDVACGNGTLLRMLSEKCDISGYGADLSEKMIENAERNCPDMQFHVASCERIPWDDQKFDVITVCAAYHHFPNVKAFAEEANRLLKPQGLLYIADVFYPSMIRVICNPFVPLSKAGDVKFYSTKQIQTNFEKCGFERIGVHIENNVQIIEMRKQ